MLFRMRVGGLQSGWFSIWKVKAKDVDLLLLFPVVLLFFSGNVHSAYVSASLFVDSKYQILH